VYAISGGRVDAITMGIELPVSHGNGYIVRIVVDPGMTYTVSRVFRGFGRQFIKGSRSGVYHDQVGDAALYASCFHTYDAEQWPEKRKGFLRYEA
jgi:hypothetical protein